MDKFLSTDFHGSFTTFYAQHRCRQVKRLARGAGCVDDSAMILHIDEDRLLEDDRLTVEREDVTREGKEGI